MSIPFHRPTAARFKGTAMGLLDWITGSGNNVEEVEDFIWLTKAAKSSGIIRAIIERLAGTESPTVLLAVAHFDGCLADVRQLLESYGIDDSRVFALRADHLPSVEDSLMTLEASDRVAMVVAERHPLPQRDRALVEFARQSRCRFRIEHHLSLEDPLLKRFAGEWTRNVLVRLGMTEDEAIQSSMVTRRVRAAQKKIDQCVMRDVDAESAEAWFERNCG
ncbi:MAG: hypothetical protein ACYC6Y_20170 [Thermoguttaceae bacterium]